MARIAILGLYNSGSTAMAGMLARMGVNLGPPYWMTSRDADERNFYEPYDLAWHLRRWWAEPRIIEQVDAAHRIRVLERWIELQEALQAGPAGAKHPLLSLCGADLLAAWGRETRFIWAYRPLEDSVRRLAARGWFRGHEPQLQQRLWDALHAFERDHGSTVRIDWARVRTDPDWGADALATAAAIDPSAAQRAHAAAIVRRP